MDPYTPITPLEPGVEMFERGKSAPLFPPGSLVPLETDLQRLSRAISEATEMWDDSLNSDDDDNATQFDEDDTSEFEEDYYQFSSSNEGRRSQTTISTFEEVATPVSPRSRDYSAAIDLARSVEGPVGPHLFRSSTHSSEFDFDFALQLSPILPKGKEPARASTGFQPLHTGSTIRGFPPNALHVSVRGVQSEDEDEPRTWSAGRVAYWMAQCGVDAATCDRFEEHDITGSILLDMNFEDLKEIDIRSFGKRHLLWHHICGLRGGSGDVSPSPTPFQDTSSIGSRRIHKKSHGDDGGVTPGTPRTKKKKAHKPRKLADDAITPAESISIVAIEQLLPKPHKCAKGENCSKWRKQQKLLKKIQEENGFPISPEKGGRIFFTGDPGNAATAPNVLDNLNSSSDSSNNCSSKNSLEQLRPTSEVIPSFVASSDVLGPGEQPVLPPGLQEQLLQQLQEQDPQDNVKHFLTLQHVEPPQPVPITPIESPKLEMFPPMPTLIPPSDRGPAPLTGLQCLPRLTIPRSASANPHGPATAGGQSALERSGLPSSVADAFSPCRTATATPSGDKIYRFGTPATETDAPVSSFPLGPDPRHMTRSVPPDMHYKDPIVRSASAATFQRRGPSFALPTLGEDEVFSPADDYNQGSSSQDSEDSIGSGNSSDTETNKLSGETQRSDGNVTVTRVKSKHDGASKGSHHHKGASHAGWMKKRRTRFLRHEWADHHFRLTGTQLAMHANSLPSSSPLDTLNIDEYAVACSSLASGKLSAKFKALSLGKEKGLDPAAFSFQLVPAPPDREGREPRKLVKIAAGGKTHHFAVRTRDERIDWMRELMLAKALREKAGEGYNIKHMKAGNTP